MLEVIITYLDRNIAPDTFSILTYLRGEGYWQFLTTDGTTVSIPDRGLQKMEIIPLQQGVTDGEPA